MLDIMGMGREELLAIEPRHAITPLTIDEVVHIAMTLEALWTYDYEAAQIGKVGLHAELKSGLHSDAFFVSKILLASENIRRIISYQIAMRLMSTKCLGKRRPYYVAGVPDGATALGEDVAGILNTEVAKMEKNDGKISLVTNIGKREILLIEDFCTKGTGLIEAATQIHESQPDAKITLFNPVILNRGGLKHIMVPEVGIFPVVSVVEKKIQSWDPHKCLLCDLGSEAIKPKATKENWIALTNSQK